MGMREGVPDGLLASRKLKVFGDIEVALTHYLPGEMEVAPLRGIAVNLHLGGTGRLVTRLEGYAGGRTWERPQRAGAVEVFAAGRPQERTLRGSISEDANVLLRKEFLGQVAKEAGVEPDHVEVLDDLDARDPQVERLLLSLLSEIETGGLGGEVVFPGSRHAARYSPAARALLAGGRKPSARSSVSPKAASPGTLSRRLRTTLVTT